MSYSDRTQNGDPDSVEALAGAVAERFDPYVFARRGPGLDATN
jgi:hypothetical protein